MKDVIVLWLSGVLTVWAMFSMVMVGMAPFVGLGYLFYRRVR